MNMMPGKLLESIRAKKPLVYNITNYVSANDCANMLLASGASPIMSDEPKEAEDIASLCDALVINMGTLNQSSIDAMLIAGKRANFLKRPVVFDPVGAGASSLRRETAALLLNEISFTAIRGNYSEIRVLSGESYKTRGVDADKNDKITAANLDTIIKTCKNLSQQTGSIVAVSGETDVVTDGSKVCCIKNGHAMMSSVTGTGCMLSSLTAAFLSVDSGSGFEAVSAAFCSFGLAGEIACQSLKPGEGNAFLRSRLIDAVYNLESSILNEGVKYEMR